MSDSILILVFSGLPPKGFMVSPSQAAGLRCSQPLKGKFSGSWGLPGSFKRLVLQFTSKKLGK